MRAGLAALCLLVWATAASGATVERYVNTASPSGGNGTTNSTTGGDPNRAYSSCAEWTSAEHADIDATNSIHKVHFEGSTADTAECNLIGWTTSATDYIWMIVDPAVRHSGSWSTSHYRLEPTTDVNSLVLLTGANHVRIEGLQLGGSGADNGNYILGIFQGASIDVQVSHTLIRSTRSGTDQLGIYITPDPTGGNIKIWNSILSGFSTSSSWALLILDGSTTLDLYNVTVAASRVGVELSTGFGTPLGRAQNVLFTANTTDAVGTFLAGTNYNATNNASIGYTVTGGGNANDRTSQTFTFVGGGDYHLQAGDGGAKNFGLTNPGSGLFSDDIDRVSRSGSWDIGADEETSGGGGGTGITGRVLLGGIGR